MSEAQQPSLDGVAIVGLAGRFPGARNVAEFWRNLLLGEESIATLSDAQLRAAGLDPVAERARGPYVPRRGLLDRPEWFDAAFFGISPREAEVMDPQQRIFLEECWTALEDAGCDPARYAGAIGIYAGMSNNTYWANNVSHHPELIENVGWLTAMMGNEKDYLATRVAYKLNLRGPAISIHTACSTSLVAVCQAVQALQSYACDAALAGGISATFPHERGYRFEDGGILSPDGHCRAFDEKAAGTVFSNGCGVVVLKRLADAVADGDQIYAVIKGAALNNDGSGKVSFTAPSVAGHAEVIALAHALAGIEPRTIGYVEAHGTGTPLGDPIEIAGLTQAFRAGTPDIGFCAIGSVKTNIGHLDAAAGIAGLIKTVLCLRHGKIPASLHFTAPNPQLALADSPFHVVQQTTDWPAGETPRRAGVSSFGVGGTNAHCVLEVWNDGAEIGGGPSHETSPLPDLAAPPLLLPLSAKTAPALAQLAENFAAWLEAHPSESLASLARTLQSGRAQFAHRLAIVAPAREIAISALRGFEPKRTFEHAAPATPPRVVFMFPGQGSQYLGMGAQLAAREPVFRDALNRCCDLLRGPLGLDLRDVLYARDQPAARDLLRETRLTQPAIFVVSYALAQLWRSWGVEPAACIGHSVGEYVAATLAGVFTLEDALGLVSTRARLVQEQPGGVMLAVRLPEAEAIKHLAGGVDLAAVNGPSLCVLSGPEDAISALENQLNADGVAAKRLETSHAFHSRMMDPVVAPLENLAGAVNRRDPQIPILSTVTAQWLRDDALSPAYWAKHARETVRFSPAFAQLATEGDYLFLECGPGQILGQLARQHGPKVVISSLREGADETATLTTGLAQLWAHGVSIKWDALQSVPGAKKISLPTYPFERKRYFAAAPIGRAKEGDTGLPPVVEPIAEAQRLSVSIGTEVAPAEIPPQTGDSAYLSRRERLQREILHLLSELSGIQLEDAEPTLSFIELGFDSLFLTQATVALHKTFKAKITFRQLLQDLPSPADLAAHLDRTLPPDSATPAPSPVPAPTTHAPAPITPAAPLKPHGPFRGIDRSAAQVTPEQQAHLNAFIERYIARTAGSKKFAAEHRPHLADPRSIAGFRREWKEMVYPLVCERSEGARLWDIDDNEYIDITLGFGQILFGHRPAWLTSAISRQLALGIEIGPTSPIAGQLAARLSRMLKLDRVAFCNTGSEAVAAALRVARTVSGRDKVVVFNGAYHGIFDEVLYRPGPMPIAPGIPASAVQNLVVLDYGTEEALAWLRAHAEELAAVMVEPVQSRRPSLAPREFLQEIRRITEAAATALIFDEIVTGFRVAPGGAQEFFGIRADLATYGKVLGGGMPIGIVAGRREYMDALDGGAWSYGDDSFPEVGVTFFAGTFVRHPLVLAAADAVLRELEQAGPDLQRTLAERAATLAARMNAHLDEKGVALHWENFSSFYHLPFPPELRHAPLIFAQMRSRGIHCWENRPCFLSLAHTPEDIDRVARAFAESVDEMVAAGLLPSSPGAASRTAVPIADYPVRTAPVAEPAPAEGAPFRLTDPQTEILLATRLGDQGNAAFNDAIALRIHGPLDVDLFVFALNEVVRRRDALRTTFDAEHVTQIVHEARPAALAQEDLRSLPEERQKEVINERIRIDAETPFDLARGPLFRAALLRTAAEERTFLFTAHHIVCDGWSFGLLAEELAAVYSAACRGMEPDLPLVLSMREYATTREPAPTEDDEWWLTQFASPPPSLSLPTDSPRGPQRTFLAATHSIDLPAPLCDALRRAAGARRSTIFSALLTGFYVLLQRLSGQHDLVVGIASAGQATLSDATLVGHCVNFLPLRLELDSTEPFADLLRRVNGLVLDAKERDSITLGRLLQRLTIPREPGRIPLTGVSFNVDRAPSAVHFDRSRADFAPLEKTLFGLELSFNLIEHAGGYRLFCHFNRTLFSQATIARWLAHYRSLLESAAAEPDLPLSGLSLTSADEQESTPEWNDTARDYPRDLSVDLLFAIQAARSPDAPALQDGASTLAYAELDASANRAAHRLLAAGVTPGSHVGLCAGRSAAFVIATLAVLKVGAVYAPIDPTWPAERLEYLIRDGNFSAIIADEVKESDAAPDAAMPPRLSLSSLADPGVPDTAPDAPERDGGDPACILYTSGSTGQPKGVIIPHRAIARLVLNTDYVSFTPDDVVAHASNPAFDAATFEVWGALLNGARLVVIPRETILSPETFAQMLVSEGITILFLTTSLFHQLAGQLPGMFQPLTSLVVGGEALRTDACAQVIAAGPPARLINGYGPTEVTTFATWYEVPREPGTASFQPIGRPIANTTAHLFDSHLREVPLGVEGEIYLGGDGVALGYWQRPELTAERFLTHEGERLYRTGDRAKRRADGTIEFLGRLDGQIKLRGYRIELSEIEAVLSQHPGIRHAAVKTVGDRTARVLAAYIVPHEPAPNLVEVRAFLAQRLPDYMVPPTYTVLDQLPLNANGKLDRRALPEPAAVKAIPARAPQNEAEARVVRLMASVLKRDNVPVDADFFLLGGHSLLAMELLSRLRSEFGVEVSASRLFESPTAESLARALVNEVNAQPAKESETDVLPAQASDTTEPPIASALAAQTDSSARTDFRHLVPVQSGTPGRQPFFLVAGGWGGEIEFLVYRQLAHHLDPAQPFWGFKARGAGTHDAPHDTVAEMAADYIKELRQIQPEGPYLLGGECVGGICAYEIACQLEAAGEKVALLVLLDTSVPSLAELDQYERDEEIKRAASARGITPGQFARQAGSKVKGFLRSLLGGSQTPAAAPPQQGQPQYPVTLMRHQLRPYGGVVTLVVDDDSYRLYGNLGWEAAPVDAINLLTLPGDHISYIREHAEVAAVRLRELLAQASLSPDV